MRFRRKTARASPRRSFFRGRKASKRSSKGGSSVKMLQFDAMIYGAVRAKISSLISPLTSKIPMGEYADEIGMGLLTYFVAKNTSGMVKDVAMKGLIIENAMIGSQLANRAIGTSQPQTNVAITQYGY